MPEPGNLKRRVSAKPIRERFKSDLPAWPAPATDTGNIKMFYAGDDHAVAVVKATALLFPQYLSGRIRTQRMAHHR